MSQVVTDDLIVAFRGERGSYNRIASNIISLAIVAFRGERGSYNDEADDLIARLIVAFRGERGSYNLPGCARSIKPRPVHKMLDKLVM